MNSEAIDQAAQEAAAAIEQAEALLVTAGAGMGVDSGLPDFRGNEGFWKAYPPFRRLGVSFVEMANPRWFATDPAQAWGFYGHRLQLYRRTLPHDGLNTLLRWSKARPRGGFVFTSNVDGHFQRTGFDENQVLECHGSLNFLQCVKGCHGSIWSDEHLQIDIDCDTFRAAEPLPRCPHCDGMARPNVLMFGDYGWLEDRTLAQQRRYEEWLQTVDPRELTIVECGAGTAVPTVRLESESHRATLIRINPHEPNVPRGGISLPCGALEGINRIARCLEGSSTDT